MTLTLRIHVRAGQGDLPGEISSTPVQGAAGGRKGTLTKTYGGDGSESGGGDGHTRPFRMGT